MVDTNRLKEMKKKLKRVVFDAESRTKIDSAKSTNDLRSLIKDFSKLVLELKTRGGSEFSDALIQLKKLRVLLSNSFKEKQQKEIDKHWIKVEEENEEAIEDMREDLEEFRDDLEERYEELEDFEAEMDRLKELQEEHDAAGEELSELDEQLKLDGVEADLHMRPDDPEVKEITEELNNQLNQQVFAVPNPFPNAPRPNFGEIFKEVLKLEPEALENRDRFNLALQNRLRIEFVRISEILRQQAVEQNIDSNSAESRIGLMEVAQTGFIAKMADRSQFGAFNSKLDGFLRLKRKESLESKLENLGGKIRDASERALSLAKGLSGKIFAVVGEAFDKVEEGLGLESDHKRRAATPFDDIMDPAAAFKKLRKE